MNALLRVPMTLAVLTGALLFTACDTQKPPPIEIPTGGPPAVPAVPVKEEVDAPLTSEADFLTLAKKSGCLVCHAIDKKVVGPAWNDVASRYKNTEYTAKFSVEETKKLLKEKVAKGGKGNWAEVTGGAPMPPYSPRISDNNISRMVNYIMDELPNNKK